MHLLRQFADPAGVTHPQIDRRLEGSNGTRATDWLVDRQLPEPVPARLAQGRDKYRDRFVAVKRRFYFEHQEGGPERLFASMTAPMASSITSCATTRTTPAICSI
jgi:hypothetical protein